MRDPFPRPPEGGPDHLVRRHLDDAARTEADAAEAVLRRVADRLRPAPPTPARWRPALAAALVAAGLLFCVFFVVQPTPAQASPDRLVAEAYQAILPEADRCYLLVVESLDRDGQPLGPPRRESHLWTRGDRYRIDQLGPDGGSFGQDEQRRIWLAPTREEALRFDPDEMPDRLALASDLRTLRLDLILRELTRNYTLEWDAEPGSSPGTRRIRATSRVERPLHGIRTVLLEVDPTTKIVRRAEIERGRLLTGQRMRITLRQIATPVRADEFYRPESALKRGAMIHERADLRRMRVLAEAIRRFGPP